MDNKYKLMVIENKKVSFSNHKTLQSLYTKMASHRLNARYCFLDDKIKEIDLKYINDYHKGIETGDTSLVMQCQGYFEEKWQEQGIKPADLLRDIKRNKLKL